MPVFEGSAVGLVEYVTLRKYIREQVKIYIAVAIGRLQHRVRRALAVWVAWDKGNLGHSTA